MSEKKWGITLIITSAVLVTAITLLFLSIKTWTVSESVQWGLRIFAIAACALQFFVFIAFAKAFKKNRQW